MKKLYGAAAKAHAKKTGAKTKTTTAGKKAKASASHSGMIYHKGYSYKNKQGKTITVKAHYEKKSSKQK